VRSEVAALRANQADILAYLVRRVDNREDAADLFGDTYLIAWRKRRSMPADPEAARKWLFVVARNTLLNHYRSGRRRGGLTDALRSELLRQEALGEPPTEEQLEVRRAIEALDHRLAELVRLVHWDGWSIADASEIMGISASTGRTRYAAARSKLQKLLALTVA
jgi:RNA polymerase sigma-70 factor (ECF subfamily)